MDLSDLTPKSDTIEVFLKHPATDEILQNEDGTEMSVTIYAPHSKEYRKAALVQARNRLKGTNTEDFSDLDLEAFEETSFELLVDVVKDWDITYKKEKPAFSKKLAREIFREVFWIKQQLEGAANDYLDFMKA